LSGVRLGANVGIGEAVGEAGTAVADAFFVTGVGWIDETGPETQATTKISEKRSAKVGASLVSSW
jgi:hypothetical protein